MYSTCTFPKTHIICSAPRSQVQHFSMRLSPWIYPPTQVQDSTVTTRMTWNKTFVSIEKIPSETFIWHPGMLDVDPCRSKVPKVSHDFHVFEPAGPAELLFEAIIERSRPAAVGEAQFIVMFVVADLRWLMFVSHKIWGHGFFPMRFVFVWYFSEIFGGFEESLISRHQIHMFRMSRNSFIAPNPRSGGVKTHPKGLASW